MAEEGLRLTREALGKFTGRQLLVVGVVLAVVVALFETVTGTFYYGSVERRLSLLRELQQLSTSGVAADPSLGPLYRDLVTQVATRPAIALPNMDLPLGKIVAGASFGLFMLIGTLLNLTGGKDPDWKGSLALGGLFTVIGAAIGAWIPDAGSPWVNVVLYLVFYVVLGIALMRGGSGPQSPQQPAQVA